MWKDFLLKNKQKLNTKVYKASFDYDYTLWFFKPKNVYTKRLQFLKLNM